jgi:hypothetical protein
VGIANSTVTQKMSKALDPAKYFGFFHQVPTGRSPQGSRSLSRPGCR